MRLGLRSLGSSWRSARSSSVSRSTRGARGSCGRSWICSGGGHVQGAGFSLAWPLSAALGRGYVRINLEVV
eukprot:10993214-Lingulodinium_polyedra.AAC.1